MALTFPPPHWKRIRGGAVAPVLASGAVLAYSYAARYRPLPMPQWVDALQLWALIAAGLLWPLGAVTRRELWTDVPLGILFLTAAADQVANGPLLAPAASWWVELGSGVIFFPAALVGIYGSALNRKRR
jgi:hypothetical protein